MTLKHPVELQHLWEVHIESWKQSGLSQRAYCQQNGLQAHRFSYWKLKLLRTQSECVDSASSSNFIQLNPTHYSFTEHSPLAIQLPNKIRIEGVQAENLHLATQLTEILQ